MAEKRMFAKTIVDSDAFLDMPQSSRLLYYDLGMRADDEGFINNPKKIMRMTGAREDDMNVLILRKFIIPFKSGVVVIKHWRLHNYIRQDRVHKTSYQDERSLLEVDENKAYKLMVDKCQSNDGQMSGEISLDKISLDYYKTLGHNDQEDLNNDPTNDLDKKEEMTQFLTQDAFECFWKLYPKKIKKKDANKKFNKACKDENTFIVIMDGLNKYLRSEQWNRNNGQFIPHPTTWINNEMWNDEIEVKDYEECSNNVTDSNGVKTDKYGNRILG